MPSLRGIPGGGGQLVILHNYSKSGIFIASTSEGRWQIKPPCRYSPGRCSRHHDCETNPRPRQGKDRPLHIPTGTPQERLVPHAKPDSQNRSPLGRERGGPLLPPHRPVGADVEVPGGERCPEEAGSPDCLSPLTALRGHRKPP